MRLSHRSGIKVIWLVVTVVIVVLVSFPLFWMISSSLKPPEQVIVSPPTLLPLHISFLNFKELLFDTYYVVYFINTIYTAGAATLISIAVGSLAAYSLTRFRFFGSSYLPYFTLFCYLLPRILLILPLYAVFNAMKLINTLHAVAIMNITFSLPFSLWLLMAYFSSIPIEIEEAAMTDGATRMQAFSKVVLPLAAPGLIATTIFVFIVSWNDYTYCLTLISENTKRTLSVGLWMMSATGFAIYWGRLLAGSTLMAIPILLIINFLQKYVVSGLTAGAVKQ